MVGIVIFNDNSAMHNNYNVNIQSLSVVATALLSIFIFYVNNRTNLIKSLGELIYKILWWACLGLFVCLLLAIEIILLASGGGVFNTPLYLAALAFGLFLAQYVINQ
jgi:hypothetical protein